MLLLGSYCFWPLSCPSFHEMFLDISNFLEEIDSLSHSYCFPLFLCIVNLRRPFFYLLLLFFGTLHLLGYIFPLLLCLLLLFFFQLFVKSPQTTTLPSCIYFSWAWFWSLLPVQFYKPWSVVFQALCLPNLILWIYSSPPLYNHKGFDLGHTWMA